MRGGTTLGRLIQQADPAVRSAAAPARCELCAAPLPDEHRHVVDVSADLVRCTCQACSLLFEREAAAHGQYRLIPRRRVRLENGAVDTGVPVGLAFFVVQPDGGVLARYPSPMGATTWECDAPAWTRMCARWPKLADLAPSVEALLVNTARGKQEHWIVPIDDCYRLVAVVREHWKGLSGGREVWPAVDKFFADLKETR